MERGTESYRRFLAGDENGLVEIIRDYKDGLILYLNSFVNHVHVAEDLAEDTFVRLAVKKPKDRQRAGFRTWLYTIGRNIAVDYLRKQQRNVTVPLEELPEQVSDREALEQSYIREERRILVHQSMGRLKPDYRQVLWLVYFEQFSMKEAARVMGKSVHSVETLAWRARQALREILEQEGYSYEELP